MARPRPPPANRRRLPRHAPPLRTNQRPRPRAATPGEAPPLCWPRPRPRSTHAPSAGASSSFQAGLCSSPRPALRASSARRSPRKPGRPRPGAEVYPAGGWGGRARSFSGLAARLRWPAARGRGSAASLARLFWRQAAEAQLTCNELHTFTAYTWINFGRTRAALGAEFREACPAYPPAPPSLEAF
ncbi:MOB kinase activator 3A isoform X2 [Balaenoptera musculus]|uniref:MOB kinase activator 3A isoform X2 n=1 Tax=Balaenoptera musculus TaxID=9771 RepID=A0A8B8X1Z8_BALMU|nr:MOB kinase activator 3A isoform X2 [Balaenoptera musculus]